MQKNPEKDTLSGSLEPLVWKIVVLESLISIFIEGQILNCRVIGQLEKKVIDQKPFNLQIGDNKDTNDDNYRPIT